MQRAAFCCLVCLAFTPFPARAQEMEPKAYSPSPVGANFLVASYSWSSGDVLFDPTLPITDVHANIQGLNLGYGHSFNLFGDLGLLTVGVPLAWADVTGKVSEQSGEVTRSGTADMRFKLSVNLLGNPAMSPREFAKAPRRTVVGASVAVSAPSGQYRRDEADQPGDRPVGRQTRDRCFGPEGSVGHGRVPRRLALCRKLRFLSRRPDAYTGLDGRDSGSRELHGAASSLARRRWHVVSRRRSAGRRRRDVNPGEQHAARPHRIVSARPTLFRQSGVWQWRSRADRNEFQHRGGGLAGLLAEPEVVGTMSLSETNSGKPRHPIRARTRASRISLSKEGVL